MYQENTAQAPFRGGISEEEEAYHSRENSVPT